VPYTEADAIADLAVSYAGRTPHALYAERASLVREFESAYAQAERRLCADHLAALDAELKSRDLPLIPSASHPPVA
jgi:hypothetical protein